MNFPLGTFNALIKFISMSWSLRVLVGAAKFEISASSFSIFCVSFAHKWKVIGIRMQAKALDIVWWWILWVFEFEFPECWVCTLYNADGRWCVHVCVYARGVVWWVAYADVHVTHNISCILPPPGWLLWKIRDEK